MTIDVTAFPLAPCSTVYPSHVFAGLYGLVDDAFIRLRVGILPKKFDSIIASLSADYKNFGRVAMIEVADSNEKKVIFYDLSDGEHLICPEALPLVDAYFKRAYLPEMHDRISKVIPYGLFYTVHGDNERHHYLRNLCCIRSRGWFKSSARHALKVLFNSRRSLNKARVSDFMLSPDISSKYQVMFQTRLFDVPFPNHPHFEINVGRINFFRRLRESLGDSLVGGVADSPIAREMAPDIISKNNSILDYIKLLKESAICISTAGLGSTNPDKIPSYLSMSRCIVSERLFHHIPAPLNNGSNIYFYDDVTECIQICEDLLGNPKQVDIVRRNAYEYFLSHAHPREVIRRSIQLSIESSY